jgi:hypothetical protein
MICIWSTSVRLTWGVASLRSIVLNMHTWASRVLKPKIQACVYQVSRNLQSATPRRSLLASAASSDKPVRASGLKSHVAHKLASPKKIKKIRADIENLSEAFGSTSLTDACERRKWGGQHFNGAANLEKSIGLSGGFPAHNSTDKSLFGSVPKHGWYAGKHQSESEVDNDSNDDCTLNKPAGTFEATGRPPNFGTASEPFLAYKEKAEFMQGTCQYQTITFQPSYQYHSLEELRLADYNQGRIYKRTNGTADIPFSAYEEKTENMYGVCQYQTITLQSPYQKHSLEELRLADYREGRRYDVSSDEECEDDQWVETDDSSSEDLDSDLDRNACDHADPDGFSCLHSSSDSEIESRLKAVR